MSIYSSRRLRKLAVVALAAGAMVASTAAASASPADGPITPMIVGGRDASQVYPWMTSILHPHPTTGEMVSYCDGSLVANDDIRGAWVLTAGHCGSIFLDDGKPTTVRVGSYNWTEGGHAAGISEIIVHPGWKWEPGNDFALLHLDRRVPEQPISIARDPGRVGDLDRILGWGAMCNLNDPAWPCYPSGLQEADVRIAPDSDCNWYDKSVELCVRGADGVAMACFGDSGGPLIKQIGHGRKARWELLGVTSRDGDAGTNPACSNGTGVWGDATKYRDWVDRVTSGRAQASATERPNRFGIAADPPMGLPYEKPDGCISTEQAVCR